MYDSLRSIQALNTDQPIKLQSQRALIWFRQPFVPGWHLDGQIWCWDKIASGVKQIQKQPNPRDPAINNLNNNPYCGYPLKYGTESKKTYFRKWLFSWLGIPCALKESTLSRVHFVRCKILSCGCPGKERKLSAGQRLFRGSFGSFLVQGPGSSIRTFLFLG